MTPTLSLPPYIQDSIRLPVEQTVSEWADANVVLSERISAEPGPFSTSRTPYLREIQDCFADPLIRKITMPASTQTGKTQVMLNCLGYAIDQDPGPAMYVLPTEDIARRFSKTRILPMLQDSAALSRHMSEISWETKTLEYHLDRMSLLMAWSGSAALLASQPIRWLMMDEVDKFVIPTDREGDRVALADERLRTFLTSSKRFIASTPTVPEGTIMREWGMSDQRRYFIPCPHCGMLQILIFKQVKFPKDERDPGRVAALDLAWYECEECECRIENAHKPTMLNGGGWRPTNPEPTDLGHRGYHINCLYSPWLGWSDIAAKYLEALHSNNPEILRNFINSWLAEPFEDRVNAIRADDLKSMADDAVRGRSVVPNATQILTAGVDWHGVKKGFYFSVWAWGFGRRQWLVDYGHVFSIGELGAELWGREFKTEDGQTLPLVVGVDSAWETAEVYAFTRPKYPTLRPTRGAETMDIPFRDFQIDYTDRRTKRRFRNFAGLRISTEYFKDRLALLLSTQDNAVDEEQKESDLQFFRNVSKEFLAHLAAEHKVRKRSGKHAWQPKYTGVPNHWLDTTIIAMAMAERFGLLRLAPKTGNQSRGEHGRRGKSKSGWKIGR